jgi:hypothetical protein
LPGFVPPSKQCTTLRYNFTASNAYTIRNLPYGKLNKTFSNLMRESVAINASSAPSTLWRQEALTEVTAGGGGADSIIVVEGEVVVIMAVIHSPLQLMQYNNNPLLPVISVANWGT